MLTRLSVRGYDAGARALARLGRSPRRFAGSEDELVAEARRSTGLSELGDERFLAGLRVLLEAYDHEARMTPFGRLSMRGQLLGSLCARLVTEAGWRRDPACLSAPVRRPLFILGLPRSGTTALHFLLAADPAHQVLENWLAGMPGPRPPREQWERDPRYRAAARWLRRMDARDPSIKSIHFMTPDGPDECRPLFMQSFLDHTFDSMVHAPSYTKWFAEQDLRPAYARHRDVLRLIQATSPERRWVLKYPAHLRSLPDLLATYPDACIVQTHRDPARAMPSVCSLMAAYRGLHEDRLDLPAIGREQLELWSGVLERGLRARVAADPARFLDLHFREIQSDPLAAVRRIYAHFGFELGPETLRRMQAWCDANPPGRHGRHAVRAERFGLSDAEIAERFGAYVARFGVEREDG